MKKSSLLFISAWMLVFAGVPAFAVEFFVDFLEPGNPGGFATGLKTFGEEYTVTVGNEIEADIYMSAPKGRIWAALVIVYNPVQISIINVEAYDGNNLSGPWDPAITLIVPSAAGPGTYLAGVGNFPVLPLIQVVMLS